MDDIVPSMSESHEENLRIFGGVIETGKITEEFLRVAREHAAVMEHLFNGEEQQGNEVVEPFSVSKYMMQIGEIQNYIFDNEQVTSKTLVEQWDLADKRLVSRRAKLYISSLLAQIDQDMTDGVYKLCMAHKLGAMISTATEFDHSKSLCFGVSQMYMLLSIKAGQLIHPSLPLGPKQIYLRWCTEYVDDYSPLNPMTGKRFDFGPENVFCTDYFAYMEICLQVHSEAKEGRFTDDLGCELLLSGAGHGDWNSSNLRRLRYSVEALAKATALDVSKRTLTRKGKALIYGEYLSWEDGQVFLNGINVFENYNQLPVLTKHGLLHAVQFLYYIEFYRSRKLVLIWDTFENRDEFMTRKSWLLSTEPPKWNERLVNFANMWWYDRQNTPRTLRKHYLNALAYESVTSRDVRGKFTIVPPKGGTFLDLHDGCNNFKTSDGRKLKVEQHGDELYLTCGRIPRWISICKGVDFSIGVRNPIVAQAKLNVEFDRIYIHRKMGTTAVLEVMMAQYHRPDVIMYAMSLIRDRNIRFRKGSSTFLTESCPAENEKDGLLLQPVLAGSILRQVDFFIRRDDSHIYMYIFGVFLRVRHHEGGVYTCSRDNREFGFLRASLASGTDEMIIV